MSKHTPGPWRFEEDVNDFDDMGRFIGADGTIVCSFGDDTAYYPTAGNPPEEADRRLIAAAPELLEALVQLCASLDKINDPQWKGSPDEIAGRAAIAKARGDA